MPLIPNQAKLIFTDKTTKQYSNLGIIRRRIREQCVAVDMITVKACPCAGADLTVEYTDCVKATARFLDFNDCVDWVRRWKNAKGAVLFVFDHYQNYHETL